MVFVLKNIYSVFLCTSYWDQKVPCEDLSQGGAERR